MKSEAVLSETQEEDTTAKYLQDWIFYSWASLEFLKCTNIVPEVYFQSGIWLAWLHASQTPDGDVSVNIT